jgi:CRP-like cAMP-binding protein
MAKDLYIARLKAVPLFAQLSKKELDGLVRHADHMRYAARHQVIREGELGEEFWLVIEGNLEVSRGGHAVATMGPGDWFGELAVIDPGPRDASVTTTTPVELMVIGRREFWGAMDATPHLMRKVIVGLAHRLRAMDAADTGTSGDSGTVDLTRQRSSAASKV